MADHREVPAASYEVEVPGTLPPSLLDALAAAGAERSVVSCVFHVAGTPDRGLLEVAGMLDRHGLEVLGIRTVRGDLTRGG